MKASNWPYCTCGDGSRVVGPTGTANVGVMSMRAES